MEAATARGLLEDQAKHLRRMRDERAAQRERDEGQLGVTETDQMGADAGTETADREMDQSLIGHADAELGEVYAALERLDAGTYGRCEECERPIADERLEARPATRYCVEHQRQDEKRAGAGGSGEESGRASGDPTSTSTNP